MKHIFSLIIFFTFWSLSSQTVLNHEKEITDPAYKYEEVEFLTSDSKFKMYGTLILPQGEIKKAVVIVPGTGMDSRNSHHNLAAELLRQNIAVFRYDDRGVGDSGGRANKANNTVTMLADDLSQCLHKLRSLPVLSGKKIGLIGHSEGGMVTMDAYASGAKVDFMIQIGTPVIKHGEFIKYQLRSGQNSFSELFKYDTEAEKLAIISTLHKTVEENKSLPWMSLHKKIDKKAKEIGYNKKRYTRFPYLTLASELDIVRKDFEPVYGSAALPILYLVGSNDTYVDPIAETQKLSELGNKNIAVKVMPGLSHYLTAGKLSIKNLYDIDAAALHEITSWLQQI